MNLPFAWLSCIQAFDINAEIIFIIPLLHPVCIVGRSMNFIGAYDLQIEAGSPVGHVRAPGPCADHPVTSPDLG